MTEPEVSQPVPENDTASATATEETLAPESEAAPPPEPWTAERVSEWNAYYDLRQVSSASSGIHSFVQLCEGFAPLAAFEDRPVDRRPRVAGDDRRFLLYGKRTVVDRPAVAVSVESGGALQAGVEFGPRQPDRPDGQPRER